MVTPFSPPLYPLTLITSPSPPHYPSPSPLHLYHLTLTFITTSSSPLHLHRHPRHLITPHPYHLTFIIISPSSPFPLITTSSLHLYHHPHHLITLTLITSPSPPKPSSPPHHPYPLQFDGAKLRGTEQRSTHRCSR